MVVEEREEESGRLRRQRVKGHWQPRPSHLRKAQRPPHQARIQRSRLSLVGK